jgi:hypothetical protein
MKPRQAAPQEARRPAQPVAQPAKTSAPLGRDTTGDVWPPAAQSETAAQETAPASTAATMPQDVPSTAPLSAPPQSAAIEPAPTDAPVVNEEVTAEAQAAESAEPAAPPPAAATQPEAGSISPHWMLMLIAAALAISGIVVPFRIAAARRRIRLDTHAFAPPAAAISERIPPRFDGTMAPRGPAQGAEHDEALQQIMRARDRRAA